MPSVHEGPSTGGGGPQVTVVVPAHDVAPYVGECVRSLLRQSIGPDLRVVVIDDGSSDDTADVVTAAAGADPRVRLVRQPNSGPGPGAARNRGLDLVETPLVLFCDGDDELTPHALAVLRDGLVRSGADLAVGATEQFPVGRQWIWTPYFVPGRTHVGSLESLPLLVHNAAAGNKLFRTAALRAGRLLFGEGMHHEDALLVVPAMLEADRILVVGDVVQRYRKRAAGDSIMDHHFRRVDNFWDHLQVVERLAERLDGLPPARRALLEAFLVRSFQGFVVRAPATLPETRLAEFLARTRVVVTRVSLDSVRSATRGAAERAAYLAVLGKDLDGYRRLPGRLDSLAVYDGNLYLDVPAPPEHRELLRLGNVRAEASGLTVSGPDVAFELAVRVPGARALSSSLSDVRLQLRPDDGGPPLSLPLRLDRGDGSRATADVCLPRADLRQVGHELRLVVRAGPGRLGRWVRRPEDAGVERTRVPWSFRHVVLEEREGRALLRID